MSIDFKRARLAFRTLVAGVGLASLLAISPAKAVVIYDTVYALTSDHCSGTGGCGADGTIFGGVGLTQNGTTVDVTVHLRAGYSYAQTGSVDDQAFKFNGSATPLTTFGISLSDITVDAHTPALQANQAQNPGDFNGDGTGHYSFGISCTTGVNPSCGGGLSPPTWSSDILFHVADATIADLTHSNGISIFVADVGVTGTGGVFAGFTGRTGPIDATDTFCRTCDINLTVVTTPEPASLALFGTAIAGVGLLARRRRKNIAA